MQTGSIPLVTKVFSICIIVFSLITFFLPTADPKNPKIIVKPEMTVVPGYALSHPWAPFIAPFVETNIIYFLINFPCWILMGQYFEKIWGRVEFTKFVLLTGISSVACSSGCLLFRYAATFDTDVLFNYPVNGLGGILCGFVVAFKQAVPEHHLKFAFISCRVKHLPSIILLIHIVLLFLGLPLTSFFLDVYGSVAAWVYLRFFKQLGNVRGDRSETFSFVSFFPDACSPYLKPLSSFIYRSMVRIRFCPPIQSDLPRQESSFDSERRKKLALQVLEERLAKVGVSSNEK